MGAVLREARLEQKLDAGSIAQSLRIGKEQLLALENGEQDLLPETVFIKAMVRRVSDRLNLDATPLIKQLDKKVELASTELSPPLQTATSPTNKKSIPKPISHKKFLTSISIFAGLVGVTFTGVGLSILNSNSDLKGYKDMTPDPAPKKIDQINSREQEITSKKLLNKVTQFLNNKKDLN